MKIVSISPEFPPVWGGLGTYAYYLTRELSKRKNIEKIYVITPNRGITRYTELGSNVEIVYTNPPTKDQVLYYSRFQIEAFNKVRAILERDKVDIIHFHTHLPDLLVKLLKKNIPILTTIHILNKDNIHAIFQSPVHDTSEKITLAISPFIYALESTYFKMRLVPYYVTVSNWMKKELIANYSVPNSHIAVTYNGVDYNIFKPRSKSQAIEHLQKKLRTIDNINEDTINVLFFSRLVGRKGIFTLLLAIEKLTKLYDINFLFAGSGGHSIVNLINSCRNTQYLGYIPEDVKPYIYNIADIFILPSFYENFPISVLEAMASQTAVVATNVGGISEIVEHMKNGILIKPKDSGSIVQALSQIIEEYSFRKKISKSGRKTVIKKFTWKKTAEETLQYYKKIWGV